MISTLILSAFIYGTFQPNFIVEKAYHKQMDDAIQQNNFEWENKLSQMDLQEPSFEFTDNDSFVSAIYQCVDYLNLYLTREERIPKLLVAAQAALESEWGICYFAEEGNALLVLKLMI